MNKCILAALLLLAACHPKVKLTSEAVTVNHGGYAYSRLNDGTFMVAAQSARDLGLALDELGCGRKFTCTLRNDQDHYYVELHAK